MTEPLGEQHLYAVGELYNKERTSWPERNEYNWRSGSHELRLFMRGLKPGEVSQIKHAPVAFGVYVERPVILLLFEIGNDLSGECPYDYFRVSPDERTLPPEVGERDHWLLHLIAVEGLTGRIAALRLLTFSPEFARTLHAAIREQAAHEHASADYDAALASIFRRYRTGQLMKRAAARCKGGA